jgi:tetratricopeptide (TPR) repeat protein
MPRRLPSPRPARRADGTGHPRYHPDLRLPEDPAELAGLYRSVLSGQQALLLFDDARDAAQLEPLLPLPTGCLALVTSRQHFHLPGLHSLPLDALPLADAVRLLLAIAPRIDKQAELLAERCGRLPLALRLTAGALHARRDLDPGEYGRRLEDASTRLKLTGVEPALQASYDLLPPELQARWRALAVFPAGFDVPAAAAVWGVEPDAARDALSELAARSLLEYEPAAGRYRLHDLARLFADRLLSAEESTRATLNHARYYLEILAQADETYLQGGEGIQAGLGLFDREWENLRAAQAWAAENVENGKEAAGMCSRFPNAGAYCLELRLHPRQLIAWLDAGLKAARLLEDLSSQGMHLGNLGIAYSDLGEPHRAIEFYQQALEIDRQIGDRRGEGADLGNLGNAYAALGEPHRAIEFYQQRIEIAHQIGDRRGEALGSWNLGDEYRKLGDLEKAAACMQVLLDYEKEISHPDYEKGAQVVAELRRQLEQAGKNKDA